LQSRHATTLAIALAAAAALSGCTGGPSPRTGEEPNASRPSAETASQLTATLRAATTGLGKCILPIGDSPYGANTDLQCSFDGKFVRFLSFTSPAAPPTAVPKLWDRTVLFGPTWLVIASDVPEARAIQAVLGGRLYLTPVLVAAGRVTLTAPTQVSRPAGSAVRFRVNVRNPMDPSAVLACHARGLSADDKVLFREQPTTADGLRRPLGPRAKGGLSGIAHLERPGAVARVISWCTARPVTQPR